MPHLNGVYIESPIDFMRDVAYVLGRTTVGDEGQLCGDVDGNGNDMHAITIYAKYKPVRWSGLESPNDSFRRQLRYGLYLNSTLSPSLSYQDPYWKYNKPRGLQQYSERFRILDFDGYNHDAEAPILPTNITLSSDGQIHIDLRTIMNTSIKAEIAVTDIFDFPYQDYIGFVLWDVTRKFGYYCITDVPAMDVVDGTIDTTAWYDFYKEIVSLPWSDDDLVEFFWATNVDNTIVHDQEGDYPAFVRIPSSGISTLSLMACDNTRGHTVFTIVKLNFDEDLDFTNHNTVISGTWNAAMTQWTLNSFVSDIQCTYGWPRSAESYETSWRIYDGDRNVFTGDRTLSAANATQYYHLSLSNGSRVYTEEQLRDDNYIITIYLYGKLTGSPYDRLFASIRYNVQTGQIIY